MSNEVMTVTREDLATMDLVEQLRNPGESFFCSIKDDGKRASRIAIYNAINSADEALADHINEVLEIVDVVAHPVTLTNEETGEIVNALRTILVDKSGKTYTAVSQGITNSLSRIFNIIGSPEGGAWHSEPVKMKVKQIKTSNGTNKVNTIELVG